MLHQIVHGTSVFTVMSFDVLMTALLFTGAENISSRLPREPRVEGLEESFSFSM
jgi:hypothetical protein